MYSVTLSLPCFLWVNNWARDLGEKRKKEKKASSGVSLGQPAWLSWKGRMSMHKTGSLQTQPGPFWRGLFHELCKSQCGSQRREGKPAPSALRLAGLEAGRNKELFSLAKANGKPSLNSAESTRPTVALLPASAFPPARELPG